MSKDEKNVNMSKNENKATKNNKKNKKKNNNKNLNNKNNIQKEKKEENVSKVEIQEEKEIKENKELPKVENVTNTKLSMGVIVIAALILILLVINMLFGNKIGLIESKKDVTKVKKILAEKYDEISCVDENCNYLVATLGNGLEKTKYSIFSISGKNITKFNINYKKTNERSTKVIGISKKYIITKTATNNGYSYSIRNMNGKVKYSTTSPIVLLTNRLAVVSTDSNKYEIITERGKTKYSDVSSYNRLLDGEYAFIQVGNDNLLLNSDNKVIYKNYALEKEAKVNGKTKFLILQNLKNKKYYYFDINKGKISGDSFNSYLKITDELYSIKNKNDSAYYLYSNGRQEEMSYNDKNNKNAIFEKLKEDIKGDNYLAYSQGVNSTSQGGIFVKDKKNGTFGVYNISNKKYKKLFDFKNDVKSPMPTLTTLDSDNNIVKVVCTEDDCNENISIVYDLNNLKSIYNEKNKDLIVSNYVEYKNDYKLIKYSYLSKNKKLSGKYVLYNKNMKSVVTADYPIIIVDEETTIGEKNDSDVILYSVEKGKKINNKTYLANKVTVGDYSIYKYNNQKGNTIIVTENGEKIIEKKAEDYVTYSNSNIIYSSENKIYSYNLKKSKLRTYNFKNNETLNDENENIVAPYRGAIVINNLSDKKVKILNSKLKVMRNINGVVLSSVKKNNDEGIEIIFVKKVNGKSDKFGVYIAK